MTDSISAYVSLPGQTEEAFTLWHSIFGGDLNIIKYGNQPMEGMPFTPDPEAVAHVTLRTESWGIAGADQAMPNEEYPVRGTAYSLLVEVESPERGKEIIERFLGAGGEINMPFALAPWGDWYGQVFDPFGVMWSLSTAQAAQAAQTNQEA
ncbi:MULTISPECIES: VOC family protein [unclassified Corynebacterium]|uniref:VOC family protein n=1 Tax=unclassified Corynebacterium TaxID=2624378 RepID=UPI0029CA664B|nr:MULTISPECIES: VOC family protein [unclassified Corynebacterium]WPF66918.1 VOC family protein [Corynebacterium sp. 22KM0430]WPF69405.1 VOC family protein [Corynebacterium sp. 21KM1197]